mmetsp:Transcript_8090/g.8240  ORF Transcript_8090/g.8240 Transcript_8090/m.8240 type:complete len:192 (-) Transcript_8090:76-651(-)
MANLIPTQYFSAFKEGLGSAFRQWTALELAVDQRWGGANSNEKAEHLINVVTNLFSTNKRVYKDDIVIILEEYMEVEFSTICEDESCAEVAELLLEMWRQCSQGDFTLVTNALGREYARHEVLNQSRGMDMGSDNEDEGGGGGGEGGVEMEAVIETMETVESVADSVPEEPRIDADGWETVGRRRSTRKKK